MSCRRDPKLFRIATQDDLAALAAAAHDEDRGHALDRRTDFDHALKYMTRNLFLSKEPESEP